MRNPLVAAILLTVASEATFARTPSKVDFARDVQPLFKQVLPRLSWTPLQQMNGLRLDERASVLKEGAHQVMPGTVKPASCV